MTILMKRVLSLATALFFLPLLASAQNIPVLAGYVREKSQICEGGVDVFNFEGHNYVVAVAVVQVESAKGTKTEAQCRTVGSAKAKRDMLAYVQGSNITSYTQLSFSETSSDGPEGRKVEATQTYVEVIREDVTGTINQTIPLCGWYSADRSLYYFALYRPVQ